MFRLTLVCLGGAIGSGARYVISLWAAAAFGAAFPWGTLLVNVVGSLLITAIAELSTSSADLPADVRLFMTTGVLGGFTTYSAFNHDLIVHARAGAWATALTYGAATVIGCLVAGLGGLAIANAIGGR